MSGHETMSLEELQAFAGELGFHLKYNSPFRRGDLHCLGFTPHGVTGWNGRPDHEFNFVDFETARRRAEEFLRRHDPEEGGPF